MTKEKAIQNIELKIISILQGATNKDNRMSLKELTVRVYEWGNFINADGSLMPISEDDMDNLLAKGGDARKKAHHRYDKIRTIRNGIFNILKNYGTNFPIMIHAPLVKYEENESGKTIARYIDENGNDSKCPVCKDKLIFVDGNDLYDEIELRIKKAENAKKSSLSEDEICCIESMVYDNSIDLSAEREKTAFPESKQWEIYYRQSYTNAEAFIILASIMNQRNIESTVINDIVRKLVKSTSDKFFEEFVKNINFDAIQDTMADEYLANNVSASPEWSVLRNIRDVIQAIATDKKINFDRIYYSCDYEKKCWITKSYTTIKCTPINIFLKDGRYWILAVNDNHNTENGNFMPCPLDLIKNINILDEKGCSVDEIKFIEKYNGVTDKSRLNEYMKTNYEKPEEFDVKVKRNQTSGNLILQTFGNDYTFIEKADEYDIIRVKRSPFGIINWALCNTRDVELIPKEEKTKERLMHQIDELRKIYNN